MLFLLYCCDVLRKFWFFFSAKQSYLNDGLVSSVVILHFFGPFLFQFSKKKMFSSVNNAIITVLQMLMMLNLWSTLTTQITLKIMFTESDVQPGATNLALPTHSLPPTMRNRHEIWSTSCRKQISSSILSLWKWPRCLVASKVRDRFQVLRGAIFVCMTSIMTLQNIFQDVIGSAVTAPDPAILEATMVTRVVMGEVIVAEIAAATVQRLVAHLTAVVAPVIHPPAHHRRPSLQCTRIKVGM